MIRRTRDSIVRARPSLVLLTLFGTTAIAFARAGTDSSPPSIRDARGLPPLVYVSRRPPDAAHAGQVPGTGPGGRFLVTGGRLLVREKNGNVRPLLPENAFFDVADPAVSYDGTRIAFAAVPHPDSAWRVWIVAKDGSGLSRVTREDRRLDLAPLGAEAKRFERYDDIDPVWLPDGRLAFVSTRFPQQAQMGGAPVSNLFVVKEDGTGLERITTERNGAEEPTIDPRTGRIVYSRWFFNPYLPSEVDSNGLTTLRARAVPGDSVNLWQALSVFLNGDGMQLAGGDPRERLSTLAVQPCVLDDGSLVAVRPGNPALLPSPGACALVVYPGGFAEPRVLAGPGTDGAAGLAGAAGSAASRAAGPTALPDGRIAFAFDPGGVGEFGLYVVRANGRELGRIADEPGWLELDPAPLVKRKVPPVLAGEGGIDDPAWTLPITDLGQARRYDDTFRFDCLNVFATGPVDSPFPDAPPLDPEVRIRFYATLARPGRALGDTAILVREKRIDTSGAVHEHDIPGDVPMFEQLVSSDGRVLRSTMGPAHVPGSNFARTGSGTKCIGCHAGHSALPVPRNNLDAKWFNASPSATVEVSGTAPDSRDGRALVDRRAKGPVLRTGWLAASPVTASGKTQSAAAGTPDPGLESPPWIRLKWRCAIEVRSLVLYAPSPDPKAGTRCSITRSELVFLRDGREIGRREIRKTLSPAGTRIELPPLRLDTVLIRLREVRGTVAGRATAALAEVETIARMIEE